MNYFVAIRFNRMFAEIQKERFKDSVLVFLDESENGLKLSFPPSEGPCSPAPESLIELRGCFP